MIENQTSRKAIRIIAYVLLAALPAAMTTMSANATEIKTTIFSMAVVLICALLAAGIHAEEGLGIHRTPLDIPIIAYLGWTALVTLILPCKYATVPQALRMLGYIVMYFTIVHHFLRRDRLKWIFMLLTVASIPPCGYGLLQHFRIDPIMWIPSSHERILAMFGNPTYFAAYLAFTMPVTFAAYLIEDRRDMRVFYLVALATQQICLLWTYSRGPWMGTLAALIITLGLSGTLHFRQTARKFGARLAWLAVALILVTIAVSYHSGIAERAASTADMNSAGNLQRVLQWKAGLRVFMKHPVFGVGPGALKVYIPENLTPAFFKTGVESVSEHAHNEFVEVAADTGIVGLGLFIWILVSASLMVWRFIKNSKRDDSWGWCYSSALLGGIVALLICNLAGVTMRYSCGAVYFWVYLGLMSAVCTGCETTVREEDFTWVSLSLPTVSTVKFVRFLVLGTVICLWFSIRPFVASVYEKQANDYISAGQAKESLSTINECLKLSPHNTSVLYRLASLQSATGSYKEAVDTYHRLQGLCPDYGRVHYNLGAEYMNLGYPLKAVKEYEKSAEIDGLPDSWRALSSAYRSSGDEKKSAWALSRCLESDPHQGWKRQMELAEILMKSGKDEKAESILKNIISDNPELLKPRMDMAAVYEKMGRRDSAIDQYKVVLRHEPGNTKALVNLGCLYYQADRIDEAKTLFQQAEKKGGGIVVDANLSLIYWKQGDTKKALKLCNYILKVDPDSDAANQARAIVYKITGEKRL